MKLLDVRNPNNESNRTHSLADRIIIELDRMDARAMQDYLRWRANKAGASRWVQRVADELDRQMVDEFHPVTVNETAPIKLEAHERIVNARIHDGVMYVYIERIH